MFTSLWYNLNTKIVQQIGICGGDWVKTYTICGSMKFAEDMKKIAYDLEISKGYKI